MWSDEDRQAALEWMEYERQLCGGCGMPRDESFDPANDDHYDAEPFTCHACAARDRKAWNREQGRATGAPPDFGVYYAIRHDGEED